MTSIIKYIVAAVILFCSNSVHAECFDTPEGIKARGAVSIICVSKEKNLKLNIYSSISGSPTSMYIALMPVQDIYCNTQHRTTKAPSKIFNGKTISLTNYCTKISDTETYSFDTPSTETEMNYVTEQILKSKPLVITSPNKDNPFKATFDTHKYRKIILAAFNTSGKYY